MMRKKLLFLGFLFLFVLAGAASLCLGSVRLPLEELWRAWREGPHSTAGYILWYSRLPRTAASILSGAALSVSGAVVQRVLHNKLASPSIIGVNAGAGLAVTICCAFGFLSGWAVAGAAFLGAMGAMLLVVLIGQKTGASRTTVILAGVAVNAMLNAFSESITTLIPEVAMMSADFRVGGFSAVSHTRLLPAGCLILLALLALLTLNNELDVLSLGDDAAKSLGMEVKRMRVLFLTLSALLAGAAVSFSGLLGFVGLIVPHAVGKLAGNDSSRLLPLCALGGGAFVAACDTTARVAFAPYELPVGILMAIIGGPVFLYLLIQKKGGHGHG